MGKKIYAVRNGKETGIFTKWEDCKENVIGVSGAEFRSFRSFEEANAYLSGKDAQTDLSQN